jgi:hypothetical protein
MNMLDNLTKGNCSSVMMGTRLVIKKNFNK